MHTPRAHLIWLEMSTRSSAHKRLQQRQAKEEEEEEHAKSAVLQAYSMYGATTTELQSSASNELAHNACNDSESFSSLSWPVSRSRQTLLLLNQEEAMNYSASEDNNCKQQTRGVDQCQNYDTITLFHEKLAGDAAPLLQRPIISNRSSNRSSNSSNNNNDKNIRPRTRLTAGKNGTNLADYGDSNSNGGGGATKNDQRSGTTREGVGKFRYLVCWLVIFSVTMNTYANYTIYIASIEMISNDVLQSELTELRAKHLSNDPLAVNKNAAAPGTCPAEINFLHDTGADSDQTTHYYSTDLLNLLPNSNSKQQQQQQQPLIATTTTTTTTTTPKTALNSSQLSALERLALQLDTAALYTSVNERLISGQLVDWTISQRGYIFTAHNLGGILLAVPINRLGLQYGSKVMIFFCIIVTGVRMLLLPTIAGQTPFWLTLGFELIMGGPGASLGILAYPIAAAWLLPAEANFFVAICQLFNLIGTAATNFISTQLLANQVPWPWCYYLPGALLCVTGLLWLLVGADRPEQCRFMSRDEIELIASALASQQQQAAKFDNNEHGATNDNRVAITVHHQGNLNSANNQTLIRQQQQPQQHEYLSCFCSLQAQRDKCPASKTKRTPNWSIIFTCPTIWALIAVNFAYHWNAKIATLWPTFFANILHMDSSTIGIITGLKGIVALLFGVSFAFVTRTLSANRPFNVSLTAYRRLNQVIATLVLALSVALMVLLDCNFWANFISVLLTPVVTGFNAISHEQMPFDLSSEDSGLLVSVIRFVSIGDIVALPASSLILAYAPDAIAGDRLTWRLVWTVGLGVKILACLFFVLVAKAKPKSYTRLEAAGPCRSETASR